MFLIRTRYRRIRHALRTEGLRGTLRRYLPAAARKMRNLPLVAGLIKRLPLSVEKKAYSFVERQLAQLTDDQVAALKEAAAQDFVLLCNSFPGPEQAYGGEFIRTRYSAYLADGLSGCVIHLARGGQQGTIEPFEQTGQKILRLPDAHIGKIADILASGSAKILCHSPMPNVQQELQGKLDNSRLVYWFHGFEVRDYRRLYFNYTTAELAPQKARIDEISAWRKEANQASFPSEDITKIFVSDYLKDIAERDNEIEANNAHVIPNFIDENQFPARPKDPALMKKILLLRSFTQRNYAGDIAIQAIKIAAQCEGFDELEFTIRGFGRNFSDLTSDVAHLPNVTIEEKYSTPDEMTALHAEHGIFLCPSRFDTQGVTMCEAMSSGMLCITNATTGIPEFIDNSCGLLVPPDDPKAMAKAILYAARHPDEMQARARAAALRVRAQCGTEQTVQQEISLIRGAQA